MIKLMITSVTYVLFTLSSKMVYLYTNTFFSYKTET